MPLNLLKSYNDLLDISGLNPISRKRSLEGVFDRDITNNTRFSFKGKKVLPTPKDGVIKMKLLFDHLTTTVIDQKTKARDFDIHRSKRLHWIKYHIEEKKRNNVLVFSVKETKGVRTYIYDIDEKYVVILEPKRNKAEYYLITAYHIMGKDAARDKFLQKYKKRRLPKVL